MAVRRSCRQPYLLDEPTNYLDIGRQLEVFDLLSRLNAERGTTIFMAPHDLSQAARHADSLVVLKNGAVVADDAPATVLAADMLAVAGVEATVLTDPVSGAAGCFPGRIQSLVRRAG